MSGSAQLLKISSYACNINYTCEVIGNGYTIWNGSAFECSLNSNEILLVHSLFSTTGDEGQCNNGAVAARSLTFNGNTYTSKLSVMVNSHLIGSTIHCAYDNLNTNSSGSRSIIGSAVLEVTPGKSLASQARPLPAFRCCTLKSERAWYAKSRA